MRYLLFFTFVACGEENPFAKDDDGDGYSEFDGDCNDNDKSIFPDAPEVCDQIDNNCNDEIDEGVLVLSYVDLDGDGYGNGNYPSENCELPAGYANNGDDCLDSNAKVYPTTEEICDGQVNDCTYIENGLNALESDTDEDGFVECEWDPETWQGSNYIRGGNDCDDENSAVHPESDEFCDEIDNNCDQIIDEDAIDQNTYFTDADGDGFGDLTDEEIYKVVLHQVAMLITEQIAMIVRNRFLQLQRKSAMRLITTVMALSTMMLQMLKYFTETTMVMGMVQQQKHKCCAKLAIDFVVESTDCDDENPRIYAIELCDGVVNNCGSSLSDNEIDGDQDGFVACTIDTDGWQGSNPNILGDDCNDTESTVYPNAFELCDGLDNDCDSNIPYDEIDNDQDGYVECSIAESGWNGNTSIINGLDCDDTNSTLSPIDEDGDGFSTCDGDCNDTDTGLNLTDVDEDGFSTCNGDCTLIWMEMDKETL